VFFKALKETVRLSGLDAVDPLMPYFKSLFNLWLAEPGHISYDRQLQSDAVVCDRTFRLLKTICSYSLIFWLYSPNASMTGQRPASKHGQLGGRSDSSRAGHSVG